MSPKTMIPSYLTPVYQALDGVRVRAVPDSPEERDGVSKENRLFPGCKACKFQVSLVMSEMEDESGAVEREVRRSRVTVWSPERPDISQNDLVAFQGLMAGAVDGTIFLQATGVERVEEASGELF